MPKNIYINFNERAPEHEGPAGFRVISEAHFGNPNIVVNEIEGSIRPNGQRSPKIRFLKNVVLEGSSEEVDWDNSIVFRPPVTPSPIEVLKRINRAVAVGNMAVSEIGVTVDARPSNPAKTSLTINQKMETPLSLQQFTTIEDLDVGPRGAGLYWLHAHSDLIDLEYSYTKKPKGISRSRYEVSLPLGDTDIDSIRWDYTEALLTPSSEPMTGFLSTNIIRESLLGLTLGTRENLDSIVLAHIKS